MAERLRSIGTIIKINASLKIVGSNWTHYVWEGGRVIGEHDATTAYTTSPPYQEKSARLDYVYASGQMIHTRERPTSTASWTTRYYVSDVWSTRLVLDASGNVLGRQGHLPFGEQFAESGTQEKHHFTSYESESESGTDYAAERAVLCRFQAWVVPKSCGQLQLVSDLHHKGRRKDLGRGENR